MVSRHDKEGVEASQPNLEDSEAIWASTKMHLQLFIAYHSYLKDIGKVDPGMNEWIVSTIASSKIIPIKVNEPPSKPPAATPRVLPEPQAYSISEDYIGPDGWHLRAKSGDDVVVYAWVADVGIAYNPRNRSAGRIPTSLVQSTGKVPETSPFICLSSLASSSYLSVGDLSWKAGDNIRVCSWQGHSRNSGIGFNIATGRIGLFHAQAGCVKILQD